MIQNKRDLYDYMEADRLALGYSRNARPRIGRDEILRFEILLRKYEYYSNRKNHIFGKIMLLYYKVRYHGLSVRLGFSIPRNVFDKGLSIAHYGSIVVNSNARVGRNCRIQENVTIGATGGGDDSPIIGDNVFIASGARILGKVQIANNIAIGANAVVTKSFLEESITIAGVPAKKISDHDSRKFIKCLK